MKTEVNDLKKESIELEDNYEKVKLVLWIILFANLLCVTYQHSVPIGLDVCLLALKCILTSIPFLKRLCQLAILAKLVRLLLEVSWYL